MEATTYKIGAKLGREEVVLTLRGISVAEENRYTARYADISDKLSFEKKADEEYAILLDALASWSIAAPEVTIGGELQEPSEASTPAEAVKEYFANTESDAQRIAQTLITGYRMQIRPEPVFY